MTAACTEEQFLRDVARHEIILIRDDEVGRHIRFKKPGTINQYFDLITWPGHLCYTGDMGTYVFARTTDMFEFFRKPRRADGSLSINLSYWTEKLIAVDGGRHGGKAEEPSEEKFRRVINEYRVEWMRSAKDRGLLDKDERRELWEAVDHDVLSVVDDCGVDRAMWAAHEFHHPHPLKGRHSGWSFEEFYEHNFNEYTHSVIWCCYALAWGIEKYDAAKQLAAEAIPA